MWRKPYWIEHKIFVQAPAEIVWRHVTEVDIASFRHPAYLSLLGIPKPLRAEITKSGVGGRRVAYFDNGRTFTQKITAWEPPIQYDITFKADPGFRAGYLLDLSAGPFQMVSGSYRMALTETGVTVSLASQYKLRGFWGWLLYLPVRVVLDLFQRYLLRGIKANAEREAGLA